MSKYFMVLTPRESIFNGKHKLGAAVTTAKAGRLATIESDGTLALADKADIPHGILIKSTSYDIMKPSYDYAVNTDLLRADTYHTIVEGQFLAQADADCFVGGTLPSVGTAIYGAVSGLLDTDSSESAVKVGIVVGQDSVQTAWNTTYSVARISFHLPTI